MKRKEIKEFLKKLGAENIHYSQNGQWVNCSCPFAEQNHENGTDENPSFGVKVNENAFSGYNCFSCEVSGESIKTITWKLDNKDISQDFNTKSASNYLDENDFESGYEPSEDDKNTAQKLYNLRTTISPNAKNSDNDEDDDNSFKEINFLDDLQEKGNDEDIHARNNRSTLTEADLSEFRAGVHHYLIDRGFSKETCKDWGILAEKDTFGNYRIVFPIRDKNNTLLAFSRRVTWDKPTCQQCHYTGKDIKYGSECPRCDNGWVYPKYQHSKGFKRNHYLYGEHMIDDDCNWGVVVEGNLDPIWLYQHGVKNAVSTLGSNIATGWPSPEDNKPGEQAYLLSELFDHLIILPDDDYAGNNWAYDIERFFDGKNHLLWTHRERCPDGKDPGELTRSEIISIFKDYPFFG